MRLFPIPDITKVLESECLDNFQKYELLTPIRVINIINFVNMSIISSNNRTYYQDKLGVKWKFYLLGLYASVV